MQHITEYLHSFDGTRLFMQSWMPDDAPRAVVAVVPGWSDHSGRYGNLVEALVPQKIGVYGLDLRGHGQSDGQRGHVNQWDEYLHDVHTYLNKLEQDYPDTPLFLMGHSMGGLVVMSYAIHHPDRKLYGIVVSSPLLAEPNVSPVIGALTRGLSGVLSRVAPRLSLDPGTDPNAVSRDPEVVARYEADPLGHNRATPRFAVEMRKTQQFILANLDAICYPLLLFYGSDDALVPPHVSREIFALVGAADKTRHEYADNRHEPINDLDKERVLSDIAAWLFARIGSAQS
jgi:alpha-beta hydrolase superfamily lysophospholipase